MGISQKKHIIRLQRDMNKSKKRIYVLTENRLNPKEQLMLVLSFIAYKDMTIPKDMQKPDIVSRHINSTLLNISPTQEMVWGPVLGEVDKNSKKDSLPIEYLHRFVAHSAMITKLVLNSKIIPLIPQGDYFPLSSPLSKLLLKFETLCDSTTRMEYTNRSLVYIAKKRAIEGETPEYTVVVRGPNPNSLSILKDDYDISTPVEWKHNAVLGSNMDIVEHPEAQACISKGTYEYLKECLELKPHGGISAVSQSMVEFLKGEINKSKGKEITINFTGHGMGGLLATTMALWFKEEVEIIKNVAIVPKVNIQAYSFGAPAPGNEKFAQLSHKLLGDKCTVYANKLDVTVYQWIRHDMKQKVLNLYSSAEIAPDPLVIEYLKIIAEMHVNWYARLKNEKYIASSLRPVRRYIDEAAFQHLYPYIFAMERKRQTEKVWSDIMAIVESLYYSWSLFDFFL